MRFCLKKRDITRQDLESVLGESKPLGEVLIDRGLVKPERVQAALAEQEHIRQIREHRLQTEVISNIRVSSGKLDKLVNLVGELVTVQARLSQTAAKKDDADLVTIAEEVERLTAELQGQHHEHPHAADRDHLQQVQTPCQGPFKGPLQGS